MPRLLFAFALVLLVAACAPAPESEAQTETITVDLVAPEALTALLPEQLTAGEDTLARQGDLTYKGYFEDSTGTGALALVTVARTYASESGVLAALNLTYYDNRIRYERIASSIGQPLRALETAADSIIAERLPGGVAYAEPFGRLVLLGSHYAVEGKSLLPEAVAAAFAAFDPSGFDNLTTTPTVVDSTFAREIE